MSSPLKLCFLLDIKANLSEAEQKFFAKYNRDLASYMRSIGDGVGIDLMSGVVPPKSLYIEVRCLQVSVVSISSDQN